MVAGSDRGDGCRRRRREVTNSVEAASKNYDT